jgi:enediyne polyketide synthase
MAQVFQALAGEGESLIFEDVKFNRPIVDANDSPLTLRSAALARESGAVDLVLRTSATSFQVDHFQARCRWSPAGGAPRDRREPFEAQAGETVEFDPARDLYGRILFHGERFQRLERYHHLQSTRCVAEIRPEPDSRWFDRVLPGQLLLGDPAVRDAALHAVQACIPHAVIVPVAAEQIVMERAGASGKRFVRAQERRREGDVFVYDLEIVDAEGILQERWRGLRLKRLEDVTLEGSWPAALLGPYVARRLSELVPGAELNVAFQPTPEKGVARAVGPRAASDRAVRHAVGQQGTIGHRPDGKPYLVGDVEHSVSIAHADDVTMGGSFSVGTVTLSRLSWKRTSVRTRRPQPRACGPPWSV